jgi:hypothetical protein
MEAAAGAGKLKVPSSLVVVVSLPSFTFTVAPTMGSLVSPLIILPVTVLVCAFATLVSKSNSKKEVRATDFQSNR